MPEMHLKQPEFTYSACSPFTKNKKRIKKFMQTGNKNYIYKNYLEYDLDLESSIWYGLW